jgi:hypothetical protein
LICRKSQGSDTVPRPSRAKGTVWTLIGCSFERIHRHSQCITQRISDLVQRSVKKDHWKQLQRMKSLGNVDGTCIFLIEGDLRTAERLTAYDAHEWT